ncbi:hypothetical protein HS088_TW08G00188 [Tripterygium wilfordii]|uniref:Uncharacterized protein n=1 Tax=Tripterygium wilfordii TaxID=458696 RepID=A0A7J7DB85_TRIWF|nr:hypothetical protein HS088_TW08G00188 [Tripterygium wilfordii]
MVLFHNATSLRHFILLPVLKLFKFIFWIMARGLVRCGGGCSGVANSCGCNGCAKLLVLSYPPDGDIFYGVDDVRGLMYKEDDNVVLENYRREQSFREVQRKRKKKSSVKACFQFLQLIWRIR